MHTFLDFNARAFRYPCVLPSDLLFLDESRETLNFKPVQYSRSVEVQLTQRKELHICQVESMMELGSSLNYVLFLFMLFWLRNYRGCRLLLFSLSHRFFSFWIYARKSVTPMRDWSGCLWLICSEVVSRFCGDNMSTLLTKESKEAISKRAFITPSTRGCYNYIHLFSSWETQIHLAWKMKRKGFEWSRKSVTIALMMLAISRYLLIWKWYINFILWDS